jgi:hypothetical protein
VAVEAAAMTRELDEALAFVARSMDPRFGR